MKKKLALLMAAIMTVAMVPMTAFAAAKTDIVAVDQIKVAAEGVFTSRVELQKDEDGAEATEHFEVILTLDNAKFTKLDDDSYEMDSANGYENKCVGVKSIHIEDDHTAKIKIDKDNFNGANPDGTAQDPVMIPIKAEAEDIGDVFATFSTNETIFADASEVIATVVDGDVIVESKGVVTFVEDADEDTKELKDITIEGAVLEALTGKEITLKLKDDYEFDTSKRPIIYLLNDNDAESKIESEFDADRDEITIKFPVAPTSEKITRITISGIYLNTTRNTDVGDIAKITVSSKDFDSVTLEVARMVEEAVTYTVEDDDLPVIWAGKDYSHYDTESAGWSDADIDGANTLEVSVEENTGDILNTSRKATFTFPEGIEVVDIEYSEKELPDRNFRYEIDENVVSIWNYSKGTVESNDETDFGIKFVINAAPTFSGDVDVTLGGEFDDVELTVATVKAPYTVEAKTSEVLIDYRYVPVNDIVITEAEEGILEEDDVIALAVEKMDFEDAGSYEVTSGDIEVDVAIDDEPTGISLNDKGNYAYLFVTVTDDSTEASTITISGLELYLDRTLPVGGYALENIGGRFTDKHAINILWENSSETKDSDNKGAYDYIPEKNDPSTGLFKYDAVTVNDSYVEVVTAGRDQDDSSTTRKIVITIGATTMAVGTETVTLDTPAYINAENYTELPLRAVSEAFGATVGWDDASRTVTIMMGQRIVSMTIGSKTMYINGTPVAMNTAPEITNERTFVPVRDLANALGITKIDWNEASATVTLN